MKKDSKSLLATKIKDLTPEVIAQLEKPLGTSDRPFPMFGTQRIEGAGGRSDIEQVLSFIGSDTHPLKVYSERPYKEVVALAYCDMPVPSMLQLFMDGLERRAPESKNRTQFLIGNPGHGKSFMGAMHGRLRSKSSVEVFDCGGKNMNELLFEMVLDFGAGDALPMSIDKRLKAGTLQSLSSAKLKQLPEAAVSTDERGDIRSIDWNYFKGAAKAGEVDTAFRIMKEVSHIEGLDNAGANALGMNSQFGPLIRWFQESREGVLDEYNKSRDGTDNSLQTVWQFLNGEIDYCKVENPLKNKDNTSGPSYFEFRREEMGIGFFVTLTGNKIEDGNTTRGLNKSVYSRLSPQTLPDPEVDDWQHRICQMMVGVPVSTLYKTYKSQADKDPDAFGEFLLSLRRVKAEIEGVAVPASQETLLVNWKDVVSSSANLAKYYDKWDTLTNSEKIMHGHNDLVEEVDDEYSKKEGIDFRKIKQHLEEAAAIRPHMEPKDTPRFANFKDFMKQPAPVEKVEENPLLSFGTRLVEFLERTAYEKSAAIGKPKLYKELLSAMKECNLRDVHLQEGARNLQKSVEESLNVSSFSDRDLGKQVIMARKVFCDYIRQVEPEIEAEDEDIVTTKKLRDALELVKQKNTAETKELFVINRDHKTLGSKPLIEARIEDEAIPAYVNWVYTNAVEQIAELKAKGIETGKQIERLNEQIAKPDAASTDDEVRQKQAAIDNLKRLKDQAIADAARLKSYEETELSMRDKDKEIDVYVSDLVHHDDFMASLAIPTVGGKNIAAVWESNIRLMASDLVPIPANQNTLAPTSAIPTDHDEAILMAEGKLDKGVSTTTLRVLFADASGEPCDVSVHIVRNNINGKTLVVGEKVPSKLLAAFNEAGVTHVDRNDPQAELKVEGALNKLMFNMSDKTRKNLTEAFKHRNDVDKEDKSKLSELLVNKNIEPQYSKYLVKGNKKAM